MISLLRSVIGNRQNRIQRKLDPIIQQINSWDPKFSSMSNPEFIQYTAQLKVRLNHGEGIDTILPEAFALVRESSKRTIGLKHFDEQLIGGIVLHQGNVAEMKTGEGKTLVATLPVYLNSLTEEGVHVVTVNDYLARRDIQWMGPVYNFVGLSVACLQHESSYMFDPEFQSSDNSMQYLRPISRQEAYNADVTYGTNHEFGFDFLRDNMAIEQSQLVQRNLNYAIVDEVDYILIDEARTPLIISGPAQEATQSYAAMARISTRLSEEIDYLVDEKTRALTLTEEGITKSEKFLNLENLYDPENSLLVHFLENSLRAEAIFKKDRDYVVKDGEVVIVDEFTGRLMDGRRYSDGLHQAIEAKEHLEVQRESLTYASITLQNYFRMYKKLSGMTGTASTESEEFISIYRLDVIEIPTHQPMVREDAPDLIFKTIDSKWKAVSQQIAECYLIGQPVLVGTTSIENSEHLSRILRKDKIPHQILNAKYHEQEAAIVSQAGRWGAVTVATNMAGRGTDIILGGSFEGILNKELLSKGYSTDTAPKEFLDETIQKVRSNWDEEHEKIIELGGLLVLGTEKHEARRIDNQLRGRSGRQGDPGKSQFYCALDDEIMKRFGGERLKGIMSWAGFEEDHPLENRAVSKTIEMAQTRVEGHNFEIRKHLVEYDDVINRHRDMIYTERRKVLEGNDIKENVLKMLSNEIREEVNYWSEAEEGNSTEVDSIIRRISSILPDSHELAPDELSGLDNAGITDKLLDLLPSCYETREQELGPEMMRRIEKLITLRTIDNHWVRHLTSMENLRQGVGLFAYGQRDPLIAYRTQGHQQFQEVMGNIQHDIAHTIFHVSVTPAEQKIESEVTKSRNIRTGDKALEGQNLNQGPLRKFNSFEKSNVKVGRNDACPCGSGKKFKRCHGFG